MITGFAHVCYTVTDLDRSVEFFQGILGFPCVFDFRDDEGKRRGVYLKTGPRSFIELFVGEGCGGVAGQSYRHICLEVDDMEATVSDLRAKGVEVGPIATGTDKSLQAWLQDPDGNRIELHQYTPDSWQTPHLG